MEYANHVGFRKVSLLKVTGGIAIVDEEDIEPLSKFHWWVNHAGYAVRDNPVKRGGCIFMHLQITGARPRQIDHINRVRLDNRKANLRKCEDISLNMANTKIRTDNKSGYKGVSARRGRWRATITWHGKQKHLGDFRSKEDAARAYDAAALDLFGEFATLNEFIISDH